MIPSLFVVRRSTITSALFIFALAIAIVAAQQQQAPIANQQQQQQQQHADRHLPWMSGGDGQYQSQPRTPYAQQQQQMPGAQQQQPKIESPSSSPVVQQQQQPIGEQPLTQQQQQPQPIIIPIVVQQPALGAGTQPVQPQQPMQGQTQSQTQSQSQSQNYNNTINQSAPSQPQQPSQQQPSQQQPIQQTGGVPLQQQQQPIVQSTVNNTQSPLMSNNTAQPLSSAQSVAIPPLTPAQIEQLIGPNHSLVVPSSVVGGPSYNLTLLVTPIVAPSAELMQSLGCASTNLICHVMPAAALGCHANFPRANYSMMASQQLTNSGANATMPMNKTESTMSQGACPLPLSAFGAAKPQCYDPNTHICVNSQFLCPMATPNLCGSQCYNATSHHCLTSFFMCPIATPLQCGESCYSADQHDCSSDLKLISKSSTAGSAQQPSNNATGTAVAPTTPTSTTNATSSSILPPQLKLAQPVTSLPYDQQQQPIEVSNSAPSTNVAPVQSSVTQQPQQQQPIVQQPVQQQQPVVQQPNQQQQQPLKQEPIQQQPIVQQQPSQQSVPQQQPVVQQQPIVQQQQPIVQPKPVVPSPVAASPVRSFQPVRQILSYPIDNELPIQSTQPAMSTQSAMNTLVLEYPQVEEEQYMD